MGWRGRGADFRILIENTAGAEFSLGGSLSRWRSWWSG